MNKIMRILNKNKLKKLIEINLLIYYLKKLNFISLMNNYDLNQNQKLKL